jgi:hypothetical protein
MPTFICLKNGQKVAEVSSPTSPRESSDECHCLLPLQSFRDLQMKGANPPGLTKMVSDNAGPVPSANTAGASSASSSKTPAENGPVSCLHLKSQDVDAVANYVRVAGIATATPIHASHHLLERVSGTRYQDDRGSRSWLER